MRKLGWVNIVLLRHRVIIMGRMTGSTILFQIKLDDEARCERKAEENGACFWRFRLGYFMYVVPGHEEAWNFGKHQDSPSGHWDQLARSIVEVYEHCWFPIIAGIHHLL